MSLAHGTRLGPYEIVAPLGAGGMGEVYRARDTRLNRDVAVKVLAAGLSADPDRLARFEQEARASAALNPPNICAVFDIGVHDGAPFIVSELLEGETLRLRMGTGVGHLPTPAPVAMRKTIEYAVQIARGLAAAHEKGIVHRDLKPENVFVTSDSRVKILDFGLAKLTQPDAATIGLTQLATSPQLTQAGMAVGTVGYMSPEQVRGLPTDYRSDIFSFGTVLFEMVSGRSPFRGDTAADTMSAILREDPPDLSSAAQHAPPALARIIAHCLEKRPEDRFRSASDLAFALEALSGSSASSPSMTASAPLTPARSTWSRFLWLPAAVGGILIGVVAARQLNAPRPETMWSGTRLAGPADATAPRISPDGDLVAFQTLVDGMNQVAVMKPATGNWNVLTRDRTHGVSMYLAWAPDGSKIYYDRVVDAPRGIFSVPSLGGEERLVLENAWTPEPLSDGTLLVARLNAERQNQLHRFWPATGAIEPLPALLGDSLADPSMRALPGGHEVVFYGRPAAPAGAQAGLYILDIQSGRHRRIAAGLPLRNRGGGGIPLAVRPDGSILVGVEEGSGHRIVSVLPRDDAAPRLELTLQSNPRLDVARDGTLYIALEDRLAEVLRVPAAGGLPERLGESARSYTGYAVAPLPDGRLLVASHAGDRLRVVVMADGKLPAPFVDTGEETRGPVTALGPQYAALFIGPETVPEIAIAAIADGRIVRRLKLPTSGDGEVHGQLSSLAASPDGGLLYYAASGSIWALAADRTAAPRKVCAGDSVTVDPQTKDLIVKLDEPEGFRLVRVQAQRGAAQPIRIEGDLRLSNRPLMPGAVRDGKLLVAVSAVDSWNWLLGVLDLKTGRLARIPVSFQADYHLATWAPDGRIIGVGLDWRSTLWRFRPVPPHAP